jgi:hypothetical protein
MLCKGVTQADDPLQHLRGSIRHRRHVVDHLLIGPVMMLNRNPGFAKPHT